MTNLHTVLHSGCNNLQPYQRCMRVPFTPHPCQHAICWLFIVAILTGVRWYLIVVIICISLMISYDEHLFICLLAIYIFFVVVIGSCMNSSYILDINLLLDISIANIFSHSVGSLFCWWFLLCFRSFLVWWSALFFFCFFCFACLFPCSKWHPKRYYSKSCQK